MPEEKVKDILNDILVTLSEKFAKHKGYQELFEKQYGLDDYHAIFYTGSCNTLKEVIALVQEELIK